MIESPDKLEVILTVNDPENVEIESRVSSTGARRKIPLHNYEILRTADTFVRTSKEAVSLKEPHVMQFEEMVNMSRTHHTFNLAHIRKSLPQTPISVMRNSRLQSRLDQTDQQTLRINSKAEPSIFESSKIISQSISPPRQGTGLTILQLPDGTCVKLILSLSYLLRKAMQHRPIRYVIKDLYINSVDEEVNSVFKHMFSLDKSSAIEGVRELDVKCDTVIISPRESLTFKLSQTGFSVEDSILFNLSVLQDSSALALPHIKNMERHMKKPRNSLDLRRNWSDKGLLSNATSQDSLLNKLLCPFKFITLPNIKLKSKITAVSEGDTEIPLTIGLFQTTQDTDLKDTYKSRMAFPKKISTSPNRYKTHRPERLYSKNFLEDSDQLVQLRQTQRFPHIAKYKMPVSFNKIRTEKNAGFRKPEKREVSPPRSKQASTMRSPERAKNFLNQGEIARARKVRKVQERVISQIGSVEDYCARYFLTNQEFMNQLEEFAILALESSKGGIGIQPEILSNFYNTNIYALRGINPRLLDPSSIDKLDVRQIITPSMLLSWQEFTVYYCLAITQRAIEDDILKFLFQLARLTHSSMLKKEVLLEAIKSKFLYPHKFTQKLQQIWNRLTESVIGVLSHDQDSEEYLSLPGIVEAAKLAEVPVLELRYLAGELFVSHINTD